MRRVDARSARRALPAGLEARVAALCEAGEGLGLGVLLVGGPVRDLLLGRALVDVDLLVEPRRAAMDDPALRLAEAVAMPGERVVAHARFGTVTLATPAGPIDLARARSEGYAAPGALPLVRPGTLAEDLARRDFAVNAMAIPLNGVARAERPALLDPLGGRGDLAARRLRILHARSFHDDPTRALRGARLAARLGLRLDAASRRALSAALAADAFAGVSGERYRAELERLFGEARQGVSPARALGLLARWGVLAALVPGLALAPALRRPLGWLGRSLAEAPEADALLAGLCVWLSAEPARRRARALERFALRGRPAERVRRFPTLARRATRALGRAATRGARDAVLRELSVEEALALGAVAASERRAVELHLRHDRALRLPLDGRDLAALGLAGPALGRTLAALRRSFLDGVWSDPALALARLAKGRAQRS